MIGPEKSALTERFSSEKLCCSGEGYVFHDPRQAPFSVHGVMWQEDGAFRRMPCEIARQVSPKVFALHTHTSGGRIRFVTDAASLAIRVKFSQVEHRPLQSYQSLMGLDLYLEKEGKEHFWKPLIPPKDTENGFCLSAALPGGPVTVVLYLPLYSDVDDLAIGLPEGASLSAPAPYGNPKPLIFYGSSITQGCAASRPGLSYVAQVARSLSSDFVNLGFSGACKGEEAMREYLAGLEASVFILDYDHNAPTPEHLNRTHRAVYRAYRERHPETPIVLVSRPTCTPDEPSVRQRREIILETYLSARAQGDDRVYFVDGFQLLNTPDRFDCVADGLHPNDLGMKRMAEIIGEAVTRACKQAEVVTKE